MAKTIPVPLYIKERYSGTNSGNCYIAVRQGTNVGYDFYNFVQSVDGEAWGFCRIPDNMAATPNAHVILLLSANAASGVTRWIVGSRIVGDSDALDGTFTNETARDITVDATALDAMFERFPASGSLTTSFTGAAGKLFQARLFHEGSHVNDTLAVDSELLMAWLMIDVE